MKIDIVYTWVHGKDPIWLEKRTLKAKQFGVILEEANNDALFMDNEELKFSLRSVSTFAPWVNNIFIVTDNQIPHWLNLSHPKIHIIDHQDIFNDKDVLPTFSSQVIETQLHHIPNLSEHFIYFNDDMFLGNECSPEYFFIRENYPRVFVSEILTLPNKSKFDISKRAMEKRNSYQHNLINTRILLRNRIGKSVYHNIRHTAKPMLKSVLYELEKTFFDEYNNTIKNSFRTNDDLLFIYLFEFYLIAKKLGKPKYLVTTDAKKKLLDPLIQSNNKFTFGYINLDEKEIDKHLERLKSAKPFTFCLNQTPGTTAENVLKAKKFLDEYFPVKSEFEI